MPGLRSYQARYSAAVSFFSLFAAIGGGLTEASADDSETQSVALPPLVVSASGIPTPEDQLGSSVTVITADDIARMQARTMTDVLMAVPGLNIVQTGSPGGATSVYMRGTNSYETKVLIDGIEASDPSSATGAFDFSQLLPSDIERIEVLRGPQSGLYGADAMGGVINVITKKGSGPASFTGMLEGGSFGTFNQAASVSGSTQRFNYAFNATHSRQENSEVTPPGLAPAGTPVSGNSSDNQTYSTKLGVNATDNLDFGLVARYTHSVLNFTNDDFLVTPAVPEPLTSVQSENSFLSRATAHWASPDGRFDQTFGLGYTYYRTYSFDPNPDAASDFNNPGVYSGDRIKGDWQGSYKFMPGQTATLGTEYQVDSIDDSTPVTASTSNYAGFVQLQSDFGGGLYNLANLRGDSNSRFGGAVTWREAPSYLVDATGTHLKASVGTAFVAPSLDELYDNYPTLQFFANPNLKPERSLGYDLGFEQPVFDRQVSFGTTWFHNSVTNLITTQTDPVTFNSTSVNIGKATTEGLESFVSWQPAQAVTLRADHTYTLAENDITDSELQRRPMHKASLTGKWQVTPEASLTSSIVYIGAWQDSGRDSGTATGGPYTLVNLAGNYDLGRGVTAFARINNLLNRTYQDPVGFQAPGIGVFGGIEVAFNVLAKGLGLTK